jgi:hypothetical protein
VGRSAAQDGGRRQFWLARNSAKGRRGKLPAGGVAGRVGLAKPQATEGLPDGPEASGQVKVRLDRSLSGGEFPGVIGGGRFRMRLWGPNGFREIIRMPRKGCQRRNAGNRDRELTPPSVRQEQQRRSRGAARFGRAGREQTGPPMTVAKPGRLAGAEAGTRRGSAPAPMAGGMAAGESLRGGRPARFPA